MEKQWSTKWQKQTPPPPQEEIVNHITESVILPRVQWHGTIDTQITVIFCYRSKMPAIPDCTTDSTTQILFQYRQYVPYNCILPFMAVSMSTLSWSRDWWGMREVLGEAWHVGEIVVIMAACKWKNKQCIEQIYQLDDSKTKGKLYCGLSCNNSYH